MATPERDNLDADLSAFLDRELSEERARQVARHVAESKQARRTLAELRDVADQLAALPRLQAPDTLADNMLGQAERRLRSGEAGAARRARVLKLFTRIGASAAALIACLFVGWQVLKRPAVVSPAEVEPPAIVHSADKLGPLVRAAGDRGYEQGVGAEPAAEHAEDAAGVARGRAPTPTTVFGVPVASVVKKTTASSEAQPLTTYSFDTALAEHDAPVVNVWVTPHSDGEYAATVAMLDNWAGRDRMSDAAREAYFVQGRGGGDQKEQLTAGPKRDVAVERVYEIPATELNDRINQLALNVDTPNQVRVQMNFIAAHSNFLAWGGQAPVGAKDAPAVAAPPARRLPTLHVSGRLADDSIVPLEEDADEESNVGKPATQQRLAGRGQPRERGLKRDEPTAAGRPGPAIEQPEAAKGPPSPPGRRGGAGRGAGGRGGLAPTQPERELGGVPRESDEAAPADRLAEAPRDTSKRKAKRGGTAGRTGVVLRPSPAASRAVAAEKLATTRPGSDLGVEASQPAELEADLAGWPVSPELTDRLFGLLFEGKWREDEGLRLGRSRGAAVRPAAAPVTFRVMLFPPPSAPASQPTTRPAPPRAENP